MSPITVAQRDELDWFGWEFEPFPVLLDLVVLLELGLPSRAAGLFSSHWPTIPYDCSLFDFCWLWHCSRELELLQLYPISNSFQNNSRNAQSSWGWRTKKRCMHPSTHQSSSIPSHPHPCFLLFRPLCPFQAKIKSHRLSLLDLILPNCIIKSPHFSHLSSPPPSSFILHPTFWPRYTPSFVPIFFPESFRLENT